MIKKNEKRKLHTDHEYMKYISTTPSVFCSQCLCIQSFGVWVFYTLSQWDHKKYCRAYFSFHFLTFNQTLNRQMLYFPKIFLMQQLFVYNYNLLHHKLNCCRVNYSKEERGQVKNCCPVFQECTCVHCRIASDSV